MRTTTSTTMRISTARSSACCSSSPRISTPSRAGCTVCSADARTEPADSKPGIVEADRDALRLGRVRRHLVTQPAFEQHELSLLHGHGHPHPVFAPRARLAWRRGHEPVEPWILELETRTTA